ncbi:PAQR family membrane homeostasis protein TrhA [Clostridium cellulovorans]|uniref:Channel protein, hemolysin III family n=1 Tax=Clostridium cellulovorans (strain ATCC 35296 / DSM 3052 / OCM 3 / 743B) TaxID=573061 RepID=D9SNP2_CLOC7|nr:hemolysin III family protein [Clostridium cellulovorans]ADL49913.1 channel protein, hemolysin III family [Clostridium cellulovorans 743B]
MKHFREPVSGFTHLGGAIVSLIGMLILITKTLSNSSSSSLALIGVILFGVSLILLYSASSIYHLAVARDTIIFYLRKLDHSMIYVLIAGTYSPVCLTVLQGKLRWIIFATIWGLALIGVLMKLFYFKGPRWISTLSYIGMGWLAVFLIPKLLGAISVWAVTLLIAGGVLYTVGAVFYQLEKGNTRRTFGAHEVFHIFVLLGSLSHYLMVFIYLI